MRRCSRNNLELNALETEVWEHPSAPYNIQQPFVNCGDLQLSGNYPFPRPEVEDQHQLHPPQGPVVVDVVSAVTEEVWSGSASATPLVWSSHKTG